MSDDYARAQAACAMVAWAREVGGPETYACDLCHAEVRYRFRQGHCWNPWRVPMDDHGCGQELATQRHQEGTLACTA